MVVTTWLEPEPGETGRTEKAWWREKTEVTNEYVNVRRKNVSCPRFVSG